MIKFIVNVEGKNYDISELISKVSFSDTLNDGCSTLEFSYIDRNFAIKNGSAVRFTYNSTKIFYGYVFRISSNKENEISVTAYDQLRYCKMRDSITVKRDTVTSLVRKMCNQLNLKIGELTDTKYILSTNIQEDTSWLDIIYSGISETKKHTNDRYLLRDEFGTIAIRDLNDLKLNLILGDKNLAYDYTYENSIDEDYYNQIKILLKGDSKKDNQYIYKKDNSAISDYGLLQYYEVMYNSNEAKAKVKAEKLLKRYNQEAEMLSISCLGDTSVRAGTSFYGSIEDINLNRRLTVKSVTHNFLPVHTMDVEAKI